MPLLEDAVAQTLSSLGMMQPQDQAQMMPPGFDPAAEAAKAISALQAPPTLGFQPPPQAAAPAPVAPAGPAPAPAPQAAPAPDAGPSLSLPKPPGSLPEANDQVASAVTEQGQTAADAGLAKFDADQARQTRQAAVAEEHANRLGQLQADRVKASANAHASADIETANHLQKLQDLAAKEPNPARWWENQSGLGKALWALSLITGSAYSALTPGARNAGLEMIRSEVDADIKRQQARLATELSALREAGGFMKDRQQRVLSDLSDEYTMALTRYQALERAADARAVVPGDLDAMAAKAQAKAMFAELKTPYISKWRDMKFQEQEQANARAHDKAMQGARFWHDKRMQDDRQEFDKSQAELDRQLKRDLAPVSVDMGMASGRNPIGKDNKPQYVEMSQRARPDGQRGVVLTDAYGKEYDDGKVLFRDDKAAEAANKAVSAGNEAAKFMTELSAALKEEGGMAEVAGVGVLSPRVEKLLTQGGYAIAQQQNKLVTDKDYSAGVRQLVGFDPDGSWLGRGKFVFNKDEIVKELDRAVAEAHIGVQNRLNDNFDPSINRRRGDSSTQLKITYNPDNLAPPAAPPDETAADVRGDGPITSATSQVIPGVAPLSKRDVPAVKNAADYDKRTKEGEENPEFASLPEHDRATVASFRAAAKGRGPDAVAAKAAATLNAIKTRREALEAEITSAHAASTDPWSPTKGTLDGEALQRAGQELARLQETEAILRPIADDATKRAKKAVEDLQDFYRRSRAWQGFDSSRANMAEQAQKKFQLRDKKAIDAALDAVDKDLSWQKK